MLSKTLLGTMCILLAVCGIGRAQTSETDEKQTADIEQLKKDVRQAQEQLSTVVGNLNEALTQVKQNKEDLQSLTELIQDALATQSQLLDAIAEYDSDGKPVLKLRALADNSQPFKDEVREIVNDSISKQGKFTITNKMPEYTRIYVNRVEHGLTPGQTLTLDVPVGTVTAQLPGKPITNWAVGAPNYLGKIDIVPDSRPPVVVERPVYVSPPAPIYVDPVPVTTYFFPPW